MMWTGIEFNNKHSYRDFGLTIADKTIGYPSKIKRTERIPFSNTVYDFSNLYGGQEYTERELTYTFNVLGPNRTKQEYVVLQTEVINWLFRTAGKVPLRDEDFPGYYFLAEVVSRPESVYKMVGGTLTITFTAYSFQIAEEEGNDLWDPFNFLLDHAQPTEFSIYGANTVFLYNESVASVYPVIRASAPMQVVMGNTTYQVPAGESNAYELALQAGDNTLKILGHGIISFHFHKEIL
ncbi:phage tail protein [Bacillus cereus]|nr:phage tail protein [Bacillus cereus]